MSRCLRQTALGLVVLLLAAGCGSTHRTGTPPREVTDGEGQMSLSRDANQTGGGNETTGGRDGTSDAGGDLGSRLSGPAGSSQAPRVSGATRGAQGSGGQRSGDSGGGPVAAGTRVPGNHPGVTDEEVTFGFLHAEGTQAFTEAVGTSGSGGNTRRQIEAAVEAVNEAGGIAGRSLRLLTYPFKVGEPVNSQMQAACAHFTEDNKTFAVSSNIGSMSGGVGTVLHECLASQDVAFIESVSPGADDLHARYPNTGYAPGTLNANRAALVTIDSLVEAGWFETDPVVGINTLDTPMWRRVIEQVVKPRLAAEGIPVAEEFYYFFGAAGPEGISGYPSATLRFRSAGVTHVLSFANPPNFFANAAESQGWRPKWSVYSDISPANWAANVPSAQLEGSLGPGWAPSRDVNAANRGDPVNNAETRCAEVMRAVGESQEDPVSWYYQLTACSSVFFLEAALPGAPEISTAGLAAGMAALQDRHLDPATWRTNFVRGRGDGLGAYRMMGFAQECSCYRYSTGLRRLPSS